MKRIFVSSTFIDMNNERDTIQQVVAPALNKLARDYGESVSFCDLRWGVDTSTLDTEEGSKKVLSVCLDEIDDCAPYMIVLLGDRYGWIPSTQLITQTVDTKPDFSLDDYEKSVTALEIEYGSLRNSDQLVHTLFYFREIQGDVPNFCKSEDPLHKEKLDALKARIQKIAGDKIRHYAVQWDDSQSAFRGMEDFSEMVIQDIHGLMEEDWKQSAALSPYDKEHLWQMDFMHRNCRAYTSCEPGQRNRLWQMNTMERSLQGAKFDVPDIIIIQTNTFLRLYGEEACGKTTCVCSAGDCAEKEGWNVLPVFCCKTESCCTVTDVQKYIIYHMESFLGLPHRRTEESVPVSRNAGEFWQERIVELCELYEKNADRNLLIFLDDMDLLARENQEELLRILPTNLGGRVRMIGVLQNKEALSHGGGLAIPLSTDSAANDVRSIVESTLKDLHRELSEDVVEAIVKKVATPSPMYINLLIHRLCMLDSEDYAHINAGGGGMQAIAEYQKKLIGKSADGKRLGAEILKIAAEQFESPELYSAMEYLAVSKYGLTEADLAALLQKDAKQWNLLAFRRLLAYLNKFFFIRSDGRIAFASKYMSYGMKEAFCEESGNYHLRLLQYLCPLAREDSLHIREIVYQCVYAGQSERLLDYVNQHQGHDKESAIIARELGVMENIDLVLDMLFYKAAASECADAWVEFVCNNWDTMFSWAPVKLNNYGCEYLPKNAEIAGALLKKEATLARRKNAIRSYLQAGEILLKSKSEAAVKQAEDFYQNAQSQLEVYLAQLPEEDALAGLRLSYSVQNHLSELYNVLSNMYYKRRREERERALDAMKNCLQIREQMIAKDAAFAEDLYYGFVYIEVARRYRWCGKGEEELPYLLQALELYEEALKKNSEDSEAQDYYSIVCDDLFMHYNAASKTARNPFYAGNPSFAELYSIERADALSEQALSYLEKSAAITEIQFKRFPIARFRKKMVLTYSRYAEFYHNLDGTENLKKALGMYEKAISVMRPITFQGEATVDAYSTMFWLQEEAGKIAKEFDSIEYKKQAIKHFRTARRAYEFCLKYHTVASFHKKIKYMEESAGDIYKQLQEVDAAWDAFKKAVRHAFIYYTLEPTEETKEWVLQCIGGLYWIEPKDVGLEDISSVCDEVFNDPVYKGHDLSVFRERLEYHLKAKNPFFEKDDPFKGKKFWDF